MLTPPLQPSSHLRRLFLDNVPAPFLRDFLRALRWVYRHADEVCREHFDDPEHHDGVGDMRRLLAEGALRDQARRHGGLARAVRNGPGTAFHSRAQFGRIRLTICAVDTPGKVRRPADFRSDLAAKSQIDFAFAKRPRDLASTTEGHSYAIIYHGHHVDSRRRPDFDPREPDFVGISFPNEDCSGSIELIDLTSQLRHEIEFAKTADVEQVDELNLKFTAKTGTKIEEE